MSVERVSEVGNTELGEGPHWDVESQCLYYVDIINGTVHKYVPSERKETHVKVTETGNVSFVVPMEGTKNKFIIGLNKKVAVITWDGQSDRLTDLKMMGEVDQADDMELNRINDGKCDAQGRLWFGTMAIDEKGIYPPDYKGHLYHLEKNKTITTHEKASLSNGLAWNKSNTKMYYIDSPLKTVDEFDFDFATGQISNRKTIFTLSQHNIEGLPDGMCIDEEDNLWVAVFNSSSVIHINPREPETLLNRIMLPAKQVTSVAFGGANLDTLYVTTAKMTVDNVVLDAPDHGGLYKITGLGAKGIKPSNCVLNFASQ